LAELCNLCVSHLASRLWDKEEAPFKAFVPQAGLPDGAPLSSVLLDLDGEALEASHWGPR
jgi:hypothetical protein